MLGSFNTRVSVNTYTDVQDAGGGTSRELSSTFDTWANVENRTGQANYQEGQRQANCDYRIRLRAIGRTLTTANTITYKGVELRVLSVRIEDEGKVSFYELQCATHGGS